MASPLHHRPAAGGPPPRSGEDRAGLDSSWERKLARATIRPDFTLDLHGQLERAIAEGVGADKAATDPDLAAIRGHRRFQKIVGVSPPDA